MNQFVLCVDDSNPALTPFVPHCFADHVPYSPQVPRDSAYKQSLTIARLRERTHVSPVECNRVPGWFRKALLKAFPGLGRHIGSLRGSSLLLSVRDMLGLGWIDHWGTTICDGQSVFAAEPYDLGPQQIESLAAFCDRIHCEFKILSDSWHFPGRTRRIVIHRQRKECTSIDRKRHPLQNA